MASPKRPVIWSLEARNDLRDIWTYYVEAAAPGSADNVVRKINEACWILQRHPYAGRPRTEVRPGLRSILANPYVVFYRLAQNEVAEIVRVIDGRRDIDEIFAETEEA
jgi:toxin ParE1/3/4